MGRASERNIELSVILPVFNAEKEINNCLSNIIKALDDKVELIIVNDGSEDKTQEIIERFLSEQGNANIILKNKNNGGVSSARNLGIKISRGKYVGFVDVDDVVAPNIYKSFLKKSEEDNFDVICCDFYEVFNGKKVDSKYDYKNEVLFEDKVVRLYLLDKISNSVWDKVFKKSLINEIKFDENLVIGEDILFCLQAFMRANKVAFLNKDLYGYVQNNSSVMHSKIDKFKQYSQVIGRLPSDDRWKLQEKYSDELVFFKLEMEVRMIHAISMANANKKDKMKVLKGVLESADIGGILKEGRFPKTIRMEIRLLKAFGPRFHLAMLPVYKLVRRVIR